MILNKRQVLIYFFSGFMDSGKTTAINNVLYGGEFSEEDGKILVIACEDGDEEYDEQKLKTVNASLVRIENEEDFNEKNLKKLDDAYKPTTVIIEYNGTWDTTLMFDMKLPGGWMLAQLIATVDATTFEMYMANMRAMMSEQLYAAELVIINRCTENTPRGKFRTMIKAINRPASIVYEMMDGSVSNDCEEPPFDLDADVIEISEADYALWYIDVMDNTEKYDGKTVRFLGTVNNPKTLSEDEFGIGRFAMTCCVEDIQFLGIKCKYDKARELKEKSWVIIEATVKEQFGKEFKGTGPVLYPVSIENVGKPDDELVYFS